MSKDFSIYDSPFSDETKKLRLNCLLSSGLCLFIGISGELPQKLSLLGISFDTAQQTSVGWFIFVVSIYMYLNFAFSAGVEVARWIQPFLAWHLTKKELLKHPYFDESYFANIPEEVDEQDLNQVTEEAKSCGNWHAQKKLKVLYGAIYPKLALEIITPFIMGAVGLISIYSLIVS